MVLHHIKQTFYGFFEADLFRIDELKACKLVLDLCRKTNLFE
jgi:hypothetical protein